MASVAVTYAANCTVVETLDEVIASAGTSSRKVTHKAFNVARSLKGTTTPAVSIVTAFRVTQASGTYALDLTALPKTGGGTFSALGLKLRQLKIVNLLTESSRILTMQGDPAVPFTPLMDSDEFYVTIPSGSDLLVNFGANGAQVSAGNKGIWFNGYRIPDYVNGAMDFQLLMTFG